MPLTYCHCFHSARLLLQSFPEKPVGSCLDTINFPLLQFLFESRWKQPTELGQNCAVDVLYWFAHFSISFLLMWQKMLMHTANSLTVCFQVAAQRMQCVKPVVKGCLYREMKSKHRLILCLLKTNLCVCSHNSAKLL